MRLSVHQAVSFLFLFVFTFSLVSAVGLDNPNLPLVRDDTPDGDTTYFPTTIWTEIAGANDTAENVTLVSTAYDGLSFNVSEKSGSPAIDVRANFTGVTDFSLGTTIIWYEGSVSHYVDICLWDYTASDWLCDPNWQISDNDHFEIITGSVFNSENYIEDGVVQMRFVHPTSGNPTHDLYIDYISISNGGNVLFSNDHDSLGGRNNILLNHPNILNVFYTETESDNLFYTETEIDTNYVPYINASKTFDLGNQQFITNGLITSTGSFRARGAVTTSGVGVDRTTVGVDFGTPRLLLEDVGYLFQIDNLNGVLRSFISSNIIMSQGYSESWGSSWSGAGAVFRSNGVGYTLNKFVVGASSLWDETKWEKFNIYEGNILIDSGTQTGYGIIFRNNNSLNGENSIKRVGNNTVYNVTDGGLHIFTGGNISVDGLIYNSIIDNSNALEWFEDGSDFIYPNGTINHEYFKECKVSQPILDTENYIEVEVCVEPDLTHWTPLRDIVTKINETTGEEYNVTRRINKKPKTKCHLEKIYNQVIYKDGYSAECVDAKQTQALAQQNEVMDIVSSEEFGNIINFKEGIMSKTILTLSKVPENNVSYIDKLKDRDKLENKSEHYAYEIIEGYETLNMEERIVALEGAVNEIFTLLCDKGILKKADGCLE